MNSSSVPIDLFPTSFTVPSDRPPFRCLNEIPECHCFPWDLETEHSRTAAPDLDSTPDSCNSVQLRGYNQGFVINAG
jgi:hypothetical protein